MIRERVAYLEYFPTGTWYCS